MSGSASSHLESNMETEPQLKVDVLGSAAQTADKAVSVAVGAGISLLALDALLSVPTWGTRTTKEQRADAMATGVFAGIGGVLLMMAVCCFVCLGFMLFGATLDGAPSTVLVVLFFLGVYASAVIAIRGRCARYEKKNLAEATGKVYRKAVNDAVWAMYGRAKETGDQTQVDAYEALWKKAHKQDCHLLAQYEAAVARGDYSHPYWETHESLYAESEAFALAAAGVSPEASLTQPLPQSPPNTRWATSTYVIVGFAILFFGWLLLCYIGDGCPGILSPAHPPTP